MEQKEILATLNADLEKLKKEDPAEYLLLLKQIKEIVSSYNTDLKAALTEATS